MAEVQKSSGRRNAALPEFLREPVEAAQARITKIEEEAERVLRDLMDRGRASRRDLENMVSRLSKQDWSFPEMKEALDRFREQGAERAAEWRGKAETFRVEAMERVEELQSKAIAFLGVATREQVEELSKELDRLSRQMAKAAKAKKGKKGAEG